MLILLLIDPLTRVCTGGERAEQIEQTVGRMRRRQYRRSVAVSQERNGDGLEVGTVQGAGTAHGQADPGVERRAQGLGPGEAQVVPGEGESVVLPAAVTDELRANVQADAGVRGADRKPHRPDERVLGPLRHRRRRRRQERG